ncbi:NfeD family protein [Elusimicrobiota bacterium]
MYWYYWIIACIIFFVIEITTPGTFFFACLGMGALIAGLISLLNLPIWIQWVTFPIVSLITIYLVRPFAKRMFEGQGRKSNVDALFGKEAVVTESIEPPNSGMIKINGEIWRAEAEEIIIKDSLVQVLSVNGTKLKVKKKS